MATLALLYVIIMRFEVHVLHCENGTLRRNSFCVLVKSLLMNASLHVCAYKFRFHGWLTASGVDDGTWTRTPNTEEIRNMQSKARGDTCPAGVIVSASQKIATLEVVRTANPVPTYCSKSTAILKAAYRMKSLFPSSPWLLWTRTQTSLQVY